MESKYILPKDKTYVIEKYSFTHLSIIKREKDAIEKIISSMYKDNMPIRKKGDLSTFHKINFLLL